MEKTVLVTGATGTIGRDVAKLLSKNGVRVRAGVRDQAKAKKQFGADASRPYTFGKWHAASDQHVRESGLAFTFLRPNPSCKIS